MKIFASVLIGVNDLCCVTLWYGMNLVPTNAGEADERRIWKVGQGGNEHMGML